MSDAKEIKACVAHNAAECFDRQVEAMMTWYAWDDQERNQAVVAWLDYALFCWLVLAAEQPTDNSPLFLHS